MTAPRDAVTPEVERATDALLKSAAYSSFWSREDHAVFARAALASLLSPSEAMVEAAAIELCGGSAGLARSEYEQMWRSVGDKERGRRRAQATRIIDAAIRAAIGDRP